MKPIKILKELDEYERLYANRPEDEGYIFHGGPLIFPMFFSSSKYDAEGYGSNVIRIKKDIFNLKHIETPGPEDIEIPDGYDGVEYKYGICMNYLIDNEEKIMNNKEDV